MPGPFLSALGRFQRPGGAWGGAKIDRPNGRSPSSWALSAPLPPSARRRFPRATTALRYGFGTENPVERTLSSTPSKPCHTSFHILSPRHLNDLRPRTPSNSQSVPYSGTGPRHRNRARMTLVFSPLSATGSCEGCKKFRYVSQFKRLKPSSRTLPSPFYSAAKPPPGDENRPLVHS